MLIINQIKKKFLKNKEEISILTDITINLKNNISYGLKGDSGSGKSTFLHIVAGIDQPTSGQVILNGRSVFDMSDQERAQKIVLITQQSFLINELTVQENIKLAELILHKNQSLIIKKIDYLLDSIGIYHLKNKHIGSLSGGQRQKVCIIRALIVEPDFLCADECTASLDEQTSLYCIDFLKKYTKDHSIGLLIASHSSAVLNKMDIVFTLKNGMIHFPS